MHTVLPAQVKNDSSSKSIVVMDLSTNASPSYDALQFIAVQKSLVNKEALQLNLPKGIYKVRAIFAVNQKGQLFSIMLKDTCSSTFINKAALEMLRNMPRWALARSPDGTPIVAQASKLIIFEVGANDVSNIIDDLGTCSRHFFLITLKGSKLPFIKSLGSNKVGHYFYINHDIPSQEIEKEIEIVIDKFGKASLNLPAEYYLFFSEIQLDLFRLRLNEMKFIYDKKNLSNNTRRITMRIKPL
jgi:hypothetical protein